METKQDAGAAPPIEWVNGDPVHAVRFALLTGATLAFCVVLATLVALVNLQEFHVIPALTASWFDEVLVLDGVVLLLLLIQLPYPRRHPALVRMGLSPLGIQLQLPLRSLKAKWEAVRWAGPDSIDVELRVSGGQRFRLNPDQVRRLAWFVQLPPPP